MNNNSINLPQNSFNKIGPRFKRNINNISINKELNNKLSFDIPTNSYTKNEHFPLDNFKKGNNNINANVNVFPTSKMAQLNSSSNNKNIHRDYNDNFYSNKINL